jgi:hypothetical protein
VRKKRGGKPESLLRDSDWEPLDGWFCRVTTLTPFPPSKGHPYASLEVEAPPLSEPTTGFVTHQLDFEHLLEAFSRSESEPDTEVQIVWDEATLQAWRQTLCADDAAHGGEARQSDRVRRRGGSAGSRRGDGGVGGNRPGRGGAGGAAAAADARPRG